MKARVAKGLASHSPIMFAPQELTSECEDWSTIVSPKRTLWNLGNSPKTKNYKNNAIKTNNSDIHTYTGEEDV